MLKIAMIKEGKIPQDKRVPLIPGHITKLEQDYSEISVHVQRSKIRCYTDSEYESAAIRLVDSIADCEILVGVKEVPIPELIANKTYLFFSHTTKEQPYNKSLLKEILKKRITLIDYEGLTDSSGKRIVAFGRYAGIVGAYNGLLTYGNKFDLYRLRHAQECFDLEDLKTEYTKVKLPPVKIALTGGGRVALGAMEVLNGAGIRKVSPEEYLSEAFDEPIYTQLNSHDYNKSRDGTVFIDSTFHKNPKAFESDFLKFAHKTDLLIAGAFWHPDAPVLFSKSDLKDNNFRIKVIADITCDIEGSIPTTIRATTIDEPIYDYNRLNHQEEPAFAKPDNISVMAIDNLPNELPRNASQDFGNELIKNVIPHFLNGDKEEVLARATITKDGKLTERFKYLQDFVDGQ